MTGLIDILYLTHLYILSEYICIVAQNNIA
jgi:hypothetical protein